MPTADVVQRRRAVDRRDELAVQSQLRRQQRRRARNPLGVFVGVVVAVLGH